MSKNLIKSTRPQVWKPTYSWYIKVFLTVFVLLLISFFVLNIVLKPYMRKINPELTPWLNNKQVSSSNNG
ncbi:MAG: hypothetical protein LBS29_06130 [Endomicrobium sp.]|jgi:hypothetical protein|uniref:hypothetical protein n=1 Tax=Candidatus Endomicrobiellum cubanum TaxID=3242325 RepID=UPI002835D969|nr:hypothetical protein [Endomicrobium sp.]MDR2395937.1 hypothetical protein [Endomicrobium sp.]